MEAVAGGHMVGRSAHEQPVLTAPRWAGQQDSSTFACRFTRYPGNKQQRTSLGSQSLRSFSLTHSCTSLLLCSCFFCSFCLTFMMTCCFSHLSYFLLLLLLHTSLQAFFLFVLFLFLPPFLLMFPLLFLFCTCSPSLPFPLLTFTTVTDLLQENFLGFMPGQLLTMYIPQDNDQNQ